MSSTGTQKKRFLNIEQWTDAFNIFASVRRLRFSAEAEGLAAYMTLIRRIAHDKGSWYLYDTTFRKLKQTTDRAWDVIDNELFILALSQKQQPFRPGGSLTQPQGRSPAEVTNLIASSFKPVTKKGPDLILYTDAFLLGWGAFNKLENYKIILIY